MEFDSFSKAEHLEKEGKQDEAFLAYTKFIEQQDTIGTAECNREWYGRDSTDTVCGWDKLALAYNNRGFLNYLRVEFKSAVQDYTQALEYSPNLAIAYYNRGLIHYRLSRFSEAVEDMQKALTLKPDLEPAQQCLSQSRADLKRKEKEHKDKS
ncbi:hypothetical protein ACOMHN_056381 [Nucella lapillus]